MPDFSLSQPADAYLDGPEWLHGLQRWKGFFSRVIEAKGEPPARY
jgi:hypothetical protein